MIVKMKKVLLLTLSKYKKESLEILRDFGAVHINSSNKNSDSLKKSIDDRRILMQAFSLLKEDGGVKALKSSNGNFLDIAKSIVNLGNEIKEFQDIKRSLLHERNLISVWGNFSLENIDELKESNIYIQFFKIQKSEYKNLLRDPNVNVLLIKNVKNTSYFVSVGEFEQKIEIADEFKFNFDLDYINNKLKVVDEILDQKLTQISLFNKYIDILRDEIKNYDQIVEFEQVLADMQTDFEDFSYITGFVPAESQESLKNAVLKAGFAAQFADPEENDIIPTYIKRKGIANLAAPIFNILETIPGYKERDISFIFMLFFFVFFGMIIGDAAYGVIFFLIGILLSLSFLLKGKPLTPFHGLIFYLSVSSILYGAMTGTWFGSPLILEMFPILNSFKVGYLTEKNSVQNIIFICFSIGVLQISLAHVWNFFRQVKEKPHIHSIAQIGWLMCIVGLYYLVLNLILSQSRFPMYNVVYNVIYFGVALVFVFGKQDGSNFFKCILKSFGGIIEQFLTTVSGFADIISYIRLFAVGLAGLSISASFNTMSIPLLKSSNIGLIVAGIIVILFGHVLNIMLSLLSVIVHGVRLNMLEFSNHLGQEWSGCAYRPFKKMKK
ncbi:V-type ATP synthase subunit I [Borreliella burgdorferi]|uniref:V-type ATP synthase subunit I n=1 Tax=Borreliella burgdorferi TaxID=139 RepID=UPI0001F23A51|nr:V-type ATP synthase subunit I [Borreliella burgdorferi]ADQ29085.1 V-type ATP synthase subunit I (V-type ATPase subunit I) [Borreliella burgdorferi N40]MCD2374003.1 V-type ATP synthase subunit I [Borreliella burgdorferi]MCD2382852.1 V-type ATP synthase subunit I [Borreliella burgdorferi]MCD2384609.1 V-type ATP synthase subunit I [Borreliella burgdorferi]MCD2389612.1 V-type ATP synthase subunit I [Borreliella burgdorferi]